MNAFDSMAKEYDQWYDEHKNDFLSEIKALEKLIPQGGKGLEIGSGTGRFTNYFHIGEAIEPSCAMREIAASKGVYLKEGFAEKLEYPNEAFDFVLMVTVICFIKDLPLAFQEAYRALKKRGALVIGFIDKNSWLGKKYEQTKKENPFYKNAIFYGVEEIIESLKKTGFKDFNCYQTLFPERVQGVEKPRKGWGQGGFIVIKAGKT